MRRFVILASLTILATAAFGKDAFLTIGGSIGAFRTDARIFNPSTTKDITIQAYYLPVGNTDNSGVQPITITVPEDLTYVLIEDPFPAGCETTERGTAAEEHTSGDWSFWWSHVDVRDTHIAFFARNMPKGKHVIEYNIRAQTLVELGHFGMEAV